MKGFSFQVMNTAVVNCIRIYFSGLLVFELLSYSNIIHFKPTFTWFGLLLTGVLAWGMIEFLNFRCQKRIHVFAWLTAAFAVSLDAFGDIFHWYASVNYYDKYVHFTNSAAATVFFLAYILAKRKRFQLSLKNLLLAFVSIQTLGVVYELEEYFEDFFTGKHLVRWGGKIDSVGDILCNISGSLVVLLVFLFLNRWFLKKSSLLSHSPRKKELHK